MLKMYSNDIISFSMCFQIPFEIFHRVTLNGTPCIHLRMSDCYFSEKRIILTLYISVYIVEVKVRINHHSYNFTDKIGTYIKKMHEND